MRFLKGFAFIFAISFLISCASGRRSLEELKIEPTSLPIKYFLNGSFQKPGAYESDKPITLLQAIAVGGGFAPFADESSILLIRTKENLNLKYQLDYNRVLDAKEPNPVLRDGDVISVR